jgi:predicted nucleotidyltransferase
MMNEQDIYDCTIYRVVHGSRAYGTNRPDSDYDEKGICIPKNLGYYYGYKTFEQKDKGWEDGSDRVIYDLRKFIKLALKCNPNIIEILYVDESDILTINELGQELRDNRDIFLTREAARSFTGYALNQLHRMKGHKRWIDNPPSKPEEKDFLKEIELTKTSAPYRIELESHKFTVIPIPDTTRPGGLRRAVAKIQHFDGASFKTANKKYQQYIKWRRDRNPDRAAIEEEHGFDLKHASHLIRLLRMGKEIITEGKVLVKRPDAEELRAIRNGERFTYEELLTYAEDLKNEVDAAVANSPLPEEPDTLKAELLLAKLISLQLGE